MTTRRGFLGFLAAAGIAVVASPVIPEPIATTPEPVSGDSDTLTFERSQRFFDIVTYTGLGSSITLPNSLGDDIGCVIIKSTSHVGDWFVLETDSVDITLPERFNEKGKRYVAYQFGKEAMPKIQPYVDKLKEMYT